MDETPEAPLPRKSLVKGERFVREMKRGQSTLTISCIIDDVEPYLIIKVAVVAGSILEAKRRKRLHYGHLSLCNIACLSKTFLREHQFHRSVLQAFVYRNYTHYFPCRICRIAVYEVCNTKLFLSLQNGTFPLNYEVIITENCVEVGSTRSFERDMTLIYMNMIIYGLIRGVRIEAHELCINFKNILGVKKSGTECTAIKRVKDKVLCKNIQE